MLLYHLYEMQHAAVVPARFVADQGQYWLRNPMNPMAWTHAGRWAAAGFDVFEHATRRYGKPKFDLDHTTVQGDSVAIVEREHMIRPFGALKHFQKQYPRGGAVTQPRLLVVAPMSGHYATLLRGTVEAMLPDHDVWITDWRDARDVPIFEGTFDLDDYIQYVIDFLEFLGPNTHMMAVCQPSVPVLAAGAIMAADGNACRPASMTLMGGPIDTRENPTVVNRLAERRSLNWFRNNVIVRVPPPNAGMFRDVYPGFLQLAGFMQMNLDRHIHAHWQIFEHLARGDGESATSKKEFYEEYRAVMDLTAEFYLQTIRTVFQEHALPKGEMTFRGRPVDPSAIFDTALLTIEGERDDISGLGQTRAAHKLCTNLPEAMRMHFECPSVGHYGIFNGRRWRELIAPKVKDWIVAHDRGDAQRSRVARRLPKVVSVNSMAAE